MARLRVPFFLLALILVPFFTFLTILWAKGYSFNLTKKKLEPRGILVATSVPDGAQVFVNGKLETATNNSLPLLPGSYSVEIKKEGFSSWKKELKIEKELVIQTNAYLFLTTPDLRPITYNGAVNPVFSPDGSKIIYSQTASESAKTASLSLQGGVWLADLVEFLGIGRGTRQIIKPVNKGRNFTKAQFIWSPDSRQILVSLNKENFLLDPNQVTNEADLQDISWNLPTIKAGWQGDEQRIEEAKMKRLPKQLQEILTQTATNFDFSLDGEKLLYQATASAQIPANLTPPLPSSSTQKEEREIQPGRIYVYDLKEDKNFLISYQLTANSSQLKWFPTSRHLLWKEKEKISLVEYDGTNKTQVFADSFEDNAVFPALGANKIILLTKFGQEANQPANLSSLNLR